MEKYDWFAGPSKSPFLPLEVEFRGHVLGGRFLMSAPGKMRPVKSGSYPKRWRRCAFFVGETKTFSECITKYAKAAAIPMSKLQRRCNEKVSEKDWVKGGGQNVFQDLRRRLAQTICLNQTCSDQTFFIISDANDLAVSAQLCQNVYGIRKTVTVFPRKLTQSQVNWSVKEKSMPSLSIYKNGRA